MLNKVNLLKLPCEVDVKTKVHLCVPALSETACFHYLEERCGWLVNGICRDACRNTETGCHATGKSPDRIA